ncbi:RluA family pseudouridine synthase [Granulicatella sp. zg-ZJ]|uniref:RluA family pseudouridine synthase n=1 Tax=Granulicatella sp. zg-ZJ TaxID=2678504 RepID=UPI0013D63FB6|nr:RluA family pseudouridine synthase [Granulicatella sp. zg-ZJ]NEW63140.1 RluA family pseudouridine synthase [Granulicatella sp. zg-ZJ]
MKETMIVTNQTERLDKVIQEWLTISRSQIQQLIKLEQVMVNGKLEKANYKVKENDVIEVSIFEEEPIDVIPENIPIEIVYQDTDVVVINKAKGMVVHPSRGHETGTLVNALLYHISSLSTGTGHVRPGIVHRIDKDTTGLLVVAKHNDAHQFLANQLRKHTMERQYVALVHGVIEHETGTIDAPIARDKQDRLKFSVQKDGKHAVTHFKVLERFDDKTLVLLHLETGRTHQIRVHMNFIGYSLVGDPLYSPYEEDKTQGQYLHAKTLGFIHPKSKEVLSFTTELPEQFQAYLETLRK